MLSSKLFLSNHFYLDNPCFRMLLLGLGTPPYLSDLVACVLRHKLKSLKVPLKSWNKQVCGNLKFRITKCVEDLRIGI